MTWRGRQGTPRQWRHWRTSEGEYALWAERIAQTGLLDNNHMTVKN